MPYAANRSDIQPSQIFYNPSTGKYQDQNGRVVDYKPVAVPVTKDQIAPKDQIYAPSVEEAYGLSNTALRNYLNSIKDFSPVGDLSKELRAVGPYQGYDWQNPADTYQSPTYAPTTALERTDFSVENLAPLAESVYQDKIAKGNKRVAKQFQDTRSQVLDEVYRNRNRPEQAAALLAELGVQEAAAAQESEQGILSEKAQQELALAQDTRNLTAQQNQAAAQERMGAATFGQAQEQYAYEQALQDAQFKQGLAQWYQEQQAAEDQSKYQSNYAYAQDLGQARLNEYETNRAAEMDRENALLQGQQAASQQFGQASTYNTNLSEGEREKSRNYMASRPNSYNTPKPKTAYKTPNGGAYA